MSTEIHLTETQLTKVLHDKQHIGLMTIQELEAWASYLNNRFNIPILFNEEQEQVIFFKAVKKMDEILWQTLPNEIYGLFREIENGIDETEIEKFKELFANILNARLDIPYFKLFYPKAEEIEKSFIVAGLDFLVSAMRKGRSILL